MSPNPSRAETSITVNGQEYSMRPTLDCMIRIEKALNKSVFALVANLATPGFLTLDDMLKIIEIGLKAGPDAGEIPKGDKLREALYEMGLAELIGACSKFLAASVGGKATATDGPDDGETNPDLGNAPTAN